MAQLNIVYKPIDALKTRANIPRTHSETQIRQLIRSVEHFGFTNPVLIDAGGTLIAGHGRVEAAKRLGLREVPTICLAEMSDADVRAYVVADTPLSPSSDRPCSLDAIVLVGKSRSFDILRYFGGMGSMQSSEFFCQMTVYEWKVDT